jgi:hypothetical protein
MSSRAAASWKFYRIPVERVGRAMSRRVGSLGKRGRE